MKNINWLKGTCFSHRGLHDFFHGIPENSIKAFENSLVNNIAIEFDIHFTKDRQIVVIHDNNLLRMCASNININSVTYQEIKKMKLMGTDCSIPLLDEVLKIVNGKVPLMIEIKDKEDIEINCSTLASKLQEYNGIFAVKSFHTSVVDWFGKERVNIICGQLLENDELWNLRKNKDLLAYFGNPDFFSVSKEIVSEQVFSSLRKQGIPILVWTIRSEEELKVVGKYSDSYIFENFIPV